MSNVSPQKGKKDFLQQNKNQSLALPKAWRQISAIADNIIKETGDRDSKITAGEEDATLQQNYDQLLERYKKAMEEMKELDNTSKRNQQLHMMKEMKFREEKFSLEERIRTIGADENEEGGTRMKKISDTHADIQGHIGQFERKTAKVLQDQERDLIRAFRTSLLEVRKELTEERKKSGSSAATWVTKCNALKKELDFFHDLTDKLTAENKDVLKRNRAFRHQLKVYTY